MRPHKRSHDLALRFGQNLFRLRRRANLSQEELGALAALHRTEIGLLENGKRVPLLDTIIKLSGSIEEEPVKLLDGMTWVPRFDSEQRRGRFYVVGAPGPQTREQGQGSEER